MKADDELIKVSLMNSNRFHAYLMFTRTPWMHFFAEEIEYFSNVGETLLGVVLLDKIDRDFAAIVLARDENNQYRAIETNTGIESSGSARDWLISRIRWLTNIGVTKVEQGESVKGVNLFSEVLNKAKQHPYFKILNEHASHLSAKELLLEIERFYTDIDGNFIEQFQSLNGFDSRLWEIYLFCFLAEENFEIIRDYDRPDFLVGKGEYKIAIEAAIVDRKSSTPFASEARVKTLEETRQENSNNMPLRFGSALFSKLKKEYWKLPHVNGNPLILAIADFHDDLSMTWSFPALIDMLYGFKHNFHYDNAGTLVIKPTKILDYTKDSGAKIPAGFFFQPGGENISGVIFSSTATLAKFNRIGKQAGFGSKKSKIVRVGACHKHDSNASIPEMFVYEVDENCSETWSEGTSLYHNPNAKYPIEKGLFLSIAHHSLIDGQIHSIIPEFHPYFSYSYNIVEKD